jgi:hypothetical protein
VKATNKASLSLPLSLSDLLCVPNIDSYCHPIDLVVSPLLSRNTNEPSSPSFPLSLLAGMILYFVGFLLIGGFFIINMFVGVIVENFKRAQSLSEMAEQKQIKEQEEAEEAAREARRERLEADEALQALERAQSRLAFLENLSGNSGPDIDMAKRAVFKAEEKYAQELAEADEADEIAAKELAEAIDASADLEYYKDQEAKWFDRYCGDFA